jgi:hypothetical protein
MSILFQDWELLCVLKSSMVISLQHLETPPTQCGFYISFFFPVVLGIHNTSCFIIIWGGRGYDFIVWVFFENEK